MLSITSTKTGGKIFCLYKNLALTLTTHVVRVDLTLPWTIGLSVLSLEHCARGRGRSQPIFPFLRNGIHLQIKAAYNSITPC